MRLFPRLFIHLPAAQLSKRLPQFMAQGWSPEIALQAQDLDGGLNYSGIRQDLLHAGLGCCIHAPFFDLNPAASDPDIARITAHRFRQTIEAAAELEASHIVFHPGYDPWRYARAPEAWLEHSLLFWPQLIEQAKAADIVLCLENIFDPSPQPLVELLQHLDSPYLRHCFDIGHWFLFSKTPIFEWLEQFSPYLYHLHLHDNRGRKDDHRPIGSGKIDFASFLEALVQLKLRPNATLEAHRTKDAEASLAALQSLLEIKKAGGS